MPNPVAYRSGARYLPGQPGHQAPIDADQIRWDTIHDEARLRAFQAAANAAGLSFNPERGLRPQMYPQDTTVTYESATNPNIPVALNADVPDQTLTWRFDHHYFITRMTYEVTALRLTSDGQSEAGFFTNLDPGSFIYLDLQRDNGDKYTIRPVTLNQVAGDGRLPYLFGLIPVVEMGSTITGKVSITPPWQPAPNAHPFVCSVAFVQITFHCERFEPWR